MFLNSKISTVFERERFLTVNIFKVNVLSQNPHFTISLAPEKNCSQPPFQTTGVKSNFYFQDGEFLLLLLFHDVIKKLILSLEDNLFSKPKLKVNNQMKLLFR